MNAVGIDVSKGKSMVAIMRPLGEIVSTPFSTYATVKLPFKDSRASYVRSHGVLLA